MVNHTKRKTSPLSAPPCLLPEPRRVERSDGVKPIEADQLIVIGTPRPANLLFEAQEVQGALSRYAGVTWHIHGANAAPEEKTGLLIALDPARGRAQGYRLEIGAGPIRITATDTAGAYYGAMTLAQLLRQYGDALPALVIEDDPDFPARGVMLDISRDKVPTMKTLFELVDLLASLKINQLQLYTEHTFAYQRHAEVWAVASPMTGEETLQLDAYCRARHVELVPNQNSFGHMTRWLTHDRYRPLAEAPDGCDTRWGHFDQPFTLCPGDPGSISLIADLYDDLLPHFTSRLLNVGCDETVDLGEGRSKADCEARGAGVVYLEFLNRIYALARQHGRTMQFWGDIIMQHPELVPQLPKDTIALEWGYEFDHPFAEHGARFAEAGIPFYVCPGTSSWNSIGGRTVNALGNLLNAAENGLKNGAIGYLNTDWGDNGHHQPLPISYLGYAYGAAVSWCVAANRELDIAQALSTHVFLDASGRTGKLVYDIGNVGQAFSRRTFNCTPYGFAVGNPMDKLLQALKGTDENRQESQQALKDIDRLERGLEKIDMQRDDAALVKRELAYALRLMRHGVQRRFLAMQLADGRAIKNGKQEVAGLRQDMRALVAEHKRVWLARNRPGGLIDSAAVLERAGRDYAAIKI